MALYSNTRATVPFLLMGQINIILQDPSDGFRLLNIEMKNTYMVSVRVAIN